MVPKAPNDGSAREAPNHESVGQSADFCWWLNVTLCIPCANQAASQCNVKYVSISSVLPYILWWKCSHIFRWSPSGVIICGGWLRVVAFNVRDVCPDRIQTFELCWVSGSNIIISSVAHRALSSYSRAHLFREHWNSIAVCGEFATRSSKTEDANWMLDHIVFPLLYCALPHMLNS